MNNFYLACVPIGNLKEASDLLKEKLESIKIIFCEDTRTTQELLFKLNIKNKPKLISCNKFNEFDRVKEILNHLENYDVMLVSDAGYPNISDPGQLIINKLVEHEINIQVINGPCALIHGLVKSGFSTKNFYFFGFLDNRKAQQIKILNELKKIKTTIILYESVHRLKSTLLNMSEVFKNNKICICKELTKRFEKFYYGTSLELITKIPNDELKGEFVILIDNNIEEEVDINWKSKAKELIKLNFTNKDIINILTIFYTNLNKNTISNFLWEINKNDK